MEMIYKDPDAYLDYVFDWLDWLDGDIITSASWIVDTGLTQVKSTNTVSTATVWLSGGNIENTYKVKNNIITSAGRRDDRTFIVKIESK